MPTPTLDAATVADLTAVRDWLVAHRADLVADLRTYVNLETPSNDKALLDKGLAWISDWIVSHLGPPAGTTRIGGGDRGDVLLLDYAGEGERPVLLLCHYDTVWNAGTLNEWAFHDDGTKITGPGAFDMKAGLVQLVWALHALRELGLPRPPVRLLLNGDEELGSTTSRSVIEEAAHDVAAVLVLEPSADAAVKTSRKGVGIFELDVTGVEAHAGLDPTKGASAIHELARLIVALREFEDLEAGTSVSVGVVAGGTRTNVIAGHARATIDVRVSSQAEAARVEAGLRGLTSSDPRISVVLGGGWNRPVMERTDEIAQMYQLARQVADRIGFELPETAAGGGSDGNFVAGWALPLLDGLGPVGAGAHSRGEWVDVAAMPLRAALVAGLLHVLRDDGRGKGTAQHSGVPADRLVAPDGATR
ncbi:M20 family metallopeptidase [Rugosimonospora africana]|uniref:Peptidase M20 n=1 Tax=Rugosimonospora africana TaxID=556532 RepID=A0A8J3VWM4_9ACTN|nr:M20 family metallopeptidase [Rugosimonospora africana]GIH20938.1 peptidase M20 [Rugosimonospora africana]